MLAGKTPALRLVDWLIDWFLPSKLLLAGKMSALRFVDFIECLLFV